jgi:predicted membrane metal-binding protein
MLETCTNPTQGIPKDRFPLWSFVALVVVMPIIDVVAYGQLQTWEVVLGGFGWWCGFMCCWVIIV